MTGAERPADARPAVAVVFGGPSAEHDVSIVSGSAIAAALADRGHPVSQVYVDLASEWWFLPGNHRRGDRSPDAYDAPASLGASGPFGAGDAAARIAGAWPRPVVFVALHGPYGEDGTVQAILETAGLAYTGSGVAASAIGMDKPLFKRIARCAGMPVLAWVEVERAAWEADRAAVLVDLDRLAAAVPDGRLIAKPARLGSSVGMGIAHRPSEREAIVEEALAYDARAIVEPCLARPRELEMCVLGNTATGLALLGPGEVIPGHEFYDTPTSTLPAGGATLAVAQVGKPLAEVRRIGGEAFSRRCCRLARVDFLLDRSSGRLASARSTRSRGSRRSALPKVAEASGLSSGAARPDRGAGRRGARRAPGATTGGPGAR
jgi:D-alanine-D-alanine ligase